MGRNVSYPQFVDVNSIQSKDMGNYRYWLRVPFKDTLSTKMLCVILKNPSVATKIICDNTVSKVCNVAKNNGYSEVIILNLFPYRSTQAKVILNFYNKPDFKNIMNHNLCIVQKLCKENDVVFGWGTNTISSSKQSKAIYDKAIKNVLLSIKSKTYYVRSCSCEGKSCSCENKSCNCQLPNVRYPLHGLRWCNKSSLIPY
ncbi:hypothetical protein CLNEO_09980 [Anaerotignum neopropionicum]|uniref:DUF1643 domain-containing protein n=1 Tax=Anaerotignum neopropionicum TaxID=36847 RepID=A0A136WGX2_9FIRM|nr:DUF1643 domain-containing protein [Anaerotignum neopropionicum]KXL53772.1 hypothetical protein CLNEO_09980 [Anaerotignum neopropionicum]